MTITITDYMVYSLGPCDVCKQSGKEYEYSTNLDGVGRFIFRTFRCEQHKQYKHEFNQQLGDNRDKADLG